MYAFSIVVYWDLDRKLFHSWNGLLLLRFVRKSFHPNNTSRIRSVKLDQPGPSPNAQNCHSQLPREWYIYPQVNDSAYIDNLFALYDFNSSCLRFLFFSFYKSFRYFITEHDKIYWYKTTTWFFSISKIWLKFWLFLSF